MLLHINYIDSSDKHQFIELLASNSMQDDSISVDWTSDTIDKIAPRLQVKAPISKLRITLHLALPKFKNIGCNGYQTWTGSGWKTPQDQELGLNSKYSPINWLYELKQYGDYSFYDYSEHNASQHSYHFIQFELEDGNFLHYQSLDETNGFTTFKIVQNKLCIEKETPQICNPGFVTFIKIGRYHGDQKSNWDKVAQNILHCEQKAKPLSGWTSWYNYGTKIDEQIITKNITAIMELDLPLDIFQIDDGWQSSVGDWKPNSKFPSGMRSLSKKIFESDMEAGLWLAPFIVERKSSIFRRHRDWIQRDSKGRLVKAGFSFGWSGNFYALDFDRSDVQDYLADVFRTIIDSWGYTMVKLDFLYAACLVPKPFETRGSRMYRAMQLLRMWTKNRIMLACGVPLASAAGIADFCRVSCDISPSWESPFQKDALRYQERVSTVSSLETSLFRAFLDGKYFNNDPDVFMLRDTNTNLTLEQKKTLFLVNQVVGSLLFTSDYIGDYDEATLKLYMSQFPLRQKEMLKITSVDNIHQVTYIEQNRKRLLLVNLNSSPVSFEMQHSENQMISETLDAFQSKIIELDSDQTLS